MEWWSIGVLLKTITPALHYSNTPGLVGYKFAD
jgi:hypothetical protein